MSDKSVLNVGTVRSVRGSIVDIGFLERLPAMHTVLTVMGERPIIMEVATHLDPQTVRAIALTSTQGLSREAKVTNTGDVPLENVFVTDDQIGDIVTGFGIVAVGTMEGAGTVEIEEASVRSNALPFTVTPN